jgi:phytanoyl-CoA hydroxylase
VGNDGGQLVNIATAPWVQLLSVPDCPLVDRVRAALRHALSQSGINAAVQECVGAYPSPTVLIDGRDVVTGEPPASQACCRLDLPTAEDILAALHKRLSERREFIVTTTTRDTTEQWLHDFREYGFVHVPQLLSEQEVKRYKTAALQAISADNGRTNDAAAVGLRTTIDGWEHDATLRSLALHPRTVAIAERLAGMPVRVSRGEVVVKGPHESRPTGLHDDETCCGQPNARIALNAWIALVDVPVERGCLTFIPGSHRRGGRERIDTTCVAAVGRDEYDSYLYTEWPELRWNPRVTVPMRAGDVTFHHRRTAHSAGANHTDDDRVSMVITFTDGAA